MNGLAVAPDDATNVALTQLDLEDGHLAARNFRQHHVVGKFDELADDKLKKFFHRAGQGTNHEPAFAQGYGVTSRDESLGT